MEVALGRAVAGVAACPPHGAGMQRRAPRGGAARAIDAACGRACH